MKKIAVLIVVIPSLFLIACSDVISFNNEVIEPATYSFIRNGENTVSFPEQTTYIIMAEELVNAFTDVANTEFSLNGMFNHQEGEDDFLDTNLNSSSLSIRTNIANSIDYYPEGEDDQNVIAIKEDFDDLITEQVTVVFPNGDKDAVKASAGKILKINDETIIYVDGRGVELNEYFNKALLGGLFMDQILNDHLSSALLDNNSNVRDNDEEVLSEGENYTNMEHEWDQAYGFLYGTNGVEEDFFLSESISLVNADADFSGIADDILSAFKLGRAAIVAKNYDIREDQAEIIKEKISLVIAVRAVYNLEKGMDNWESDKGLAFHQISKALGYIYSLQFTRKPNTTTTPAPYFTKAEVDVFLTRLLGTGDGLWEINTINTLTSISTDIATAFDFTVLEASN